MKQNCLLLLLVSAFFGGCDPIDKRLYLNNESDEIIFYSLSVSDTIMGRSPFVNTFRVEQSDTVWDESSNLILPDSGKPLTIIGKNAWEEYINKNCEDSTLRIFLFEKRLISSIPWDSIKQKGLFTKKYLLSVKDLERMGWHVVIGN